MVINLQVIKPGERANGEFWSRFEKTRKVLEEASGRKLSYGWRVKEREDEKDRFGIISGWDDNAEKNPFEGPEGRAKIEILKGYMGALESAVARNARYVELH